jgi:hypothetical protein
MTYFPNCDTIRQKRENPRDSGGLGIVPEEEPGLDVGGDSISGSEWYMGWVAASSFSSESSEDRSELKSPIPEAIELTKGNDHFPKRKNGNISWRCT